jgi:hypothetical protein
MVCSDVKDPKFRAAVNAVLTSAPAEHRKALSKAIGALVSSKGWTHTRRNTALKAFVKLAEGKLAASRDARPAVTPREGRQSLPESFAFGKAIGELSYIRFEEAWSEPSAETDEAFVKAVWAAARRIYGPLAVSGHSCEGTHHVARVMIGDGIDRHMHRDDGPGWSGFARAATRTVALSMSTSLLAEGEHDDSGRRQLHVATKMIVSEIDKLLQT